MNCIYKQIAWLWPLIFLTGCVKDILIELPTESPRLVAQSAFEAERPFRVFLSMTQPVSSVGRPPLITEAEVYVEQEGVRVATLSPMEVKGQIFWTDSFKVKNDIPYTLHARTPGFPPVFATSSAPLPVQPQVVTLQKDRADTLSNGHIRQYLLLQTQLPPLLPVEPFFGFSLQVARDLYKDTIPQPVWLRQESRPAAFSTNDGTTALVYNVSDSISVLHQNYWQRPTRDLELIVSVDYNPRTEVLRDLTLTWFTLSEDFYRHHLSLSRQGANIPFSDPDALYTNVTGGYGYFSGFSRVQIKRNIPK
jgi:hypothetical protein